MDVRRTRVHRQARDLPLDSHLHTDLSPDSPVRSTPTPRRRRTRHRRARHHRPRRLRPGRARLRLRPFEVRERTSATPPSAGHHKASRSASVSRSRTTAARGRIRDHLRGHAYDFVIGSVHVYARRRTTAIAWRRGRRQAARRDRRAVLRRGPAAIRSGLFDTIGHLDFVKRYLVPHVTPADLAAAPELYEPLLRALVETGTALEVNTSGLRQVLARRTRARRSWAVQGARRHALSAGSDAHDVGHSHRGSRRVRPPPGSRALSR